MVGAGISLMMRVRTTSMGLDASAVMNPANMLFLVVLGSVSKMKWL